MRIASVRIQNYRSFTDQTLRLEDYSCLVGPNGSGKSAVLCALNILFREASNPTNVQSLAEEDYHDRDTSEPVTITATFTGLSAAAKEDLKAYVRQDQLVLSAKAVWDPAKGTGEVKQYGERLVMRAFAPFFEAETAHAKVSELKQIYEPIAASIPDLPPSGTKEVMLQALRSYEESHPEFCELLASEDQFYGWSRGQNRLAPYCQWVYVPAVKDATEEQEEGRNTALGQLLQRSVRSKVDFATPLAALRDEVQTRYEEIVTGQQPMLATLSAALQARLQEWAHPGASVDLHWHVDPSKSVAVNEPLVRAAIGEGTFSGELARLGHGLQRSFLVALLQELSTSDAEDGPTLLLGLEEPELYQHPSQARHLANVLERLSGLNAQVIATTHSPYFVSGKGFECVRLVRKDELGASRVSAYSYEELAAALGNALDTKPDPPTAVMAAMEQILQPSQGEMFFASVPVLVEGQEDVAFLGTQMHLSGLWDEFRKLGCHFVVCDGKTNMSRPLGVALGLGMPAFAVFDGDLDGRPEEAAARRRDNACILRLCGHTDVDPEPLDDNWCSNLLMWRTKIAAAVKEDLGSGVWETAEARARSLEGLTNCVRQKNPLLISATLEVLHKEGATSPRLAKACEAILAFARKPTGPVPAEPSSATSVAGAHT